jgi:hypothetical protein
MKTFDEMRSAAEQAELGGQILVDAGLLLQLFWACEALEYENEILRDDLGDAEQESSVLRMFRGNYQ